MKKTKLLCFFALLFTLTLSAKPSLAWSNGGYSADLSQPDYGTHDWVAQHALDYLPSAEKQYITDNLAGYLYGTELPDNGGAADGIGDTGKHHIYYYANGTIQDDSSAIRASEEYQKTLSFLRNHNYREAAKEAGIMSHYIADMGVFGHMMGAKTAWGTEIHHSDFEDHVNDKSGVYNSTFTVFLQFDGALTNLSSYNAAKNLAFNTTFGDNNSLGCLWMDANYNWSSQQFSNRTGESLNLAVNAVADVLHTLYLESGNVVPEFPSLQVISFALLLTTAVVLFFVKTGRKVDLGFDVR